MNSVLILMVMVIVIYKVLPRSGNYAMINGKRHKLPNDINSFSFKTGK